MDEVRMRRRKYLDSYKERQRKEGMNCSERIEIWKWWR